LYGQRTTSVGVIQGAFDIGGSGGISVSLQNLMNAFARWSNAPNDGANRQGVLTAAADLGVTFGQTTRQLQAASADMYQQTQSLVQKINTLGAHLAELNQSLRTQGRSDNSVEAEVYANLEELSSLADFTVVPSQDGTFTVLVGGQVPLVVGDRSFALTAGQQAVATPGAPPAVVISDANGKDITSVIQGGNLAGVIQTINVTLGKILGDNNGIGTLNQLASSFAARVNQLLTSGQIDNTVIPPSAGVPLFSVGAGATAAATLQVAPGMTPDQLAAIDPGPPLVANGIATQLAGLSNSNAPADQINGLNYPNYYGNIAADVGDQVQTSQAADSRYTQLLSQARSLRSQISGVSLDEEATMLMQFQRSYQAAAKTVTTVNSMMDTLMNLIPG